MIAKPIHSIGDKPNLENHRAIVLVSISCKARVLLNKIRDQTKSVLSETQEGFSPKENRCNIYTEADNRKSSDCSL